MPLSPGSVTPPPRQADQVRALRERRGWTVEHMADEAHASALEVSAWEVGAVRVPAEQALRGARVHRFKGGS